MEALGVENIFGSNEIDNLFSDLEEPAVEETKTVYLKPGIWDVDNATERYAAYVFKAGDVNEWIDFVPVNNAEGYYAANIPVSYTGLILARMDGGKTENNWDNKWNQTVDLAPTDDNNQFTVVAKNSSNYYTGTWSVFGAGPVLPEETKTVYAINDVKWVNLNFYWWGSNTACTWPGYAMDSYSGSTVYTCTIPADATGLVFHNGKGGIK